MVTGPDGYSTHLEALGWALLQAPGGGVIELGAGWYSTPLLHGLIAGSGWPLVTIEGDPGWLERFRRFESEDHALVLDPAYDVEPWLRDVALVFVDQDLPGPTRDVSVRRCWDLGVPRVVVHDADPQSQIDFAECEHLEPALALWPHRRDFYDLRPGTTVVWR